MSLLFSLPLFICYMRCYCYTSSTCILHMCRATYFSSSIHSNSFSIEKSFHQHLTEFIWIRLSVCVFFFSFIISISVVSSPFRHRTIIFSVHIQAKVFHNFAVCLFRSVLFQFLFLHFFLKERNR